MFHSRSVRIPHLAEYYFMLLLLNSIAGLHRLERGPVRKDAAVVRYGALEFGTVPQKPQPVVQRPGEETRILAAQMADNLFLVCFRQPDVLRHTVQQADFGR